MVVLQGAGAFYTRHQTQDPCQFLLRRYTENHHCHNGSLSEFPFAARVPGASGGKGGGIHTIFSLRTIDLEPSQNVLRRPRESLSVVGQPVHLILSASPQTPQTMEIHPLPVDNHTRGISEGMLWMV